MTHDDAHAEHGLDHWLATAMASLDRALDDVLNLDSGLVDAKLPNLRDDLTRDLDQVLDLDAGLDDILPARRPPVPTAGPPAPQPTGDLAQTPLGAFAGDFTALPAHERLAARAWLPVQELIELHHAVRLVLRAEDLIHNLADDRDLAHALTRDRDLAHARDLAHDLAYDLTRDHDLAHDLAYDLTRDLTFARDLAHALNRDRDLAHTLAQTRDLAYARDLAHALTHDLAHTLDLADTLTHDLARARDRAHAHALNRVRSLDRTSNLVVALYSALRREVEIFGERHHAHDFDLEEDLGRLIEAATNVNGADLSQLDLRGIPLLGLRWSEATQWPVEWRDRIRRDSIELHPGHYEIRQGGIDIDHRIDTQV
ncbi:hypothetical protein AB0F52_29940 [Amycolatopsis sp. NPDC024027]|uniref:hypothetical protein n=1 Tax=Amycolatopsis sp. NPDC024027 TaxID=3154327 RepID=UPI0033F86651